MSWLDPSELRVGLGCMRLADATAEATVAAALDAGITVFDTARAYGGNEALLGRTLQGTGARIVTKGGMGAGWVPDGRARSVRADCDASLAALAGLPIDLYLLHAPDPRVPWQTSVRALGRLVEEGLVRRVGVANVNRRQLDEAVELAPVAAVQVPVSLLDDTAERGGVIERCEELGLAVMAHSPVGGPRRVRRLLGNETLLAVAAADGAEPGEVALAWVLGVSPAVVAIPGAGRPETARSSAWSARLCLPAADRERLGSAFGRVRVRRGAQRREGEVVMVMGIPGAGKSVLAAGYAGRGFARLNRDERGGTLRGVAEALDELLASGAERVVVDNTYLTRAARSRVVEVGARHGLPLGCVWLDTPLAQAQVNLVERFLDRLGRLPSPDELRTLSRRDPGLLAPTSQMRALRELEPPATDEGFAAVERVPFARRPREGGTAVLVAAAAISSPALAAVLAAAAPAAPHLVFDWRPEASVDELAPAVERVRALVAGPVEPALCPHGGGPPACWCRPPLPGLPLAFARTHGADPARSVLVGTTAAHRTLAATLNARYVSL